jgi:hypothetical protein
MATSGSSRATGSAQWTLQGLLPARLLPTAPDSVLTFKVAWNWNDVGETAFIRLVRNYGAWCEQNRAGAHCQPIQHADVWAARTAPSTSAAW